MTKPSVPMQFPVRKGPETYPGASSWPQSVHVELNTANMSDDVLAQDAARIIAQNTGAFNQFVNTQRQLQAAGIADVYTKSKTFPGMDVTYNYMHGLERVVITPYPSSEEAKAEEQRDIILDGYVCFVAQVFGTPVEVDFQMNGESMDKLTIAEDDRDSPSDMYMFVFGKEALKSHSEANDDPNPNKLLMKILPKTKKHGLFAYPMYRAGSYYLSSGDELSTTGPDEIKYTKKYDHLPSSPLKVTGLNKITLDCLWTPQEDPDFSSIYVFMFAEFYDRGKLRPVYQSWHFERRPDEALMEVNDKPLIFFSAGNGSFKTGTPEMPPGYWTTNIWTETVVVADNNDTYTLVGPDEYCLGTLSTSTTYYWMWSSVTSSDGVTYTSGPGILGVGEVITHTTFDCYGPIVVHESTDTYTPPSIDATTGSLSGTTPGDPGSPAVTHAKLEFEIDLTPGVKNDLRWTSWPA